MKRYSPYYIISVSAVIGAFFVGGALASAADIIREEARTSGKAEVMLMIPIEYLTEIDI